MMTLKRKSTERRCEMIAINMPGFTAEVSLYRGSGFNTGLTVSQVYDSIPLAVIPAQLASTPLARVFVPDIEDVPFPDPRRNPIRDPIGPFDTRMCCDECLRRGDERMGC